MTCASAARGKTEDLQQRNRLESDIRAGKINIILTIELSRLSRDDSMQDYTAWLHLCSQHGGKLATPLRSGFLSPGGRSQGDIMGYRFELKLTKAPGTQQARILLKNHPRDENGNIPITPNCCGMAELEMAIDRLHAELEAIKKEAKRRFRQT